VHYEPDFNPKTFFDKILDYDKRNYIMLSCSKNVESIEVDGILANHAYTLISAHKVSNGAKVLKLRNPWGNKEWTGAWSDKWTGWTP
jgi:hypothetical protein